MFLDYLALGLLLFVVTGLFYIFFYIHDIPYEFAEKRHHPQKDAIYWGCWVSMFTLHALWPFLFIWAVSNTPRVQLADGSDAGEDKPAEHHGVAVAAEPPAAVQSEVQQLRQQIGLLQDRLAAIEGEANGRRAP